MLAGTRGGVAILLAHGANPNDRTVHGMTPLDLAKVLGWTDGAELLLAHGPK